jgi:tape measure domain-containing protein
VGAVITDTLATKLDLLGLGTYTSGLSRAAQALGLVEAAESKAATASLSLAAGAGAASLGLTAMWVRAGLFVGQMERLKTSLETATGGAGAAQEQFDSASTSMSARRFGSENAVKGALNLRNMGADAEFTAAAIQAAGNATAAAGGDSEQFLGITEKLSYAFQSQHLAMRELKAMMHSSGPAFKELADSMGVTVPQLEGMEFHGLNAQRVIRMLVDAINEKQGGALARDLGTLPGKLADLSYEAKQAESYFGKFVDGPLSKVVDITKGAVKAFNDAPKPVKDVTAAVGVGLTLALGGYSAATAWALVNTGNYTKALLDLQIQAGKTAGAVATAGGANATAGTAGSVAAGAGAGAGAIARGAGGFVARAVSLLGNITDFTSGEDERTTNTRLRQIFHLGGPSSTASDTAKKPDPHLTELQKQTQVLNGIRSDLTTLARGEAFDTTQIPGGLQALAAMRRAMQTH